MNQSASNNPENNYAAFIKELTALTRKYGVIIQSIGGVHIAQTPEEFANVTYHGDPSSGDLYPVFPND